MKFENRLTCSAEREIEDLTEVAISVAAYMSVLGKVFNTFEEAQEAVRDIIMKGKALDTFKRFIASQGGDARVVDQPELLPTADYHVEVKAKQAGFINRDSSGKNRNCRDAAWRRSGEEGRSD